MTHEDMMAFAKTWIDNWNRRDVDAVLSHFAADAEFVSPLAAKYSGTQFLKGHEAIGGYWRAALSRITTLEFTLDHAIWDERRRELLVVTDANLNGERRRAAEIMCFGADGQQIRGEALYGATL